MAEQAKSRNFDTGHLDQFQRQFFQWGWVERKSFRQMEDSFNLLFEEAAAATGIVTRVSYDQWRSRYMKWREDWPSKRKPGDPPPTPESLLGLRLWYANGEKLIQMQPYIPILEVQEVEASTHDPRAPLQTNSVTEPTSDPRYSNQWDHDFNDISPFPNDQPLGITTAYDPYSEGDSARAGAAALQDFSTRGSFNLVEEADHPPPFTLGASSFHPPMVLGYGNPSYHHNSHVVLPATTQQPLLHSSFHTGTAPPPPQAYPVVGPNELQYRDPEPNPKPEPEPQPQERRNPRHSSSGAAPLSKRAKHSGARKLK